MARSRISSSTARPARFEIGKTLSSTSSDPAVAVLAGLKSMLEAERFAGRSIEAVIHATTIATNTVLERKGPPTALLTTKGFGTS